MTIKKDELAADKARLQSELERIQNELNLVDAALQTEHQQFPKETTIYLHSDMDSMWELGEELGLAKDAIRENFRGVCYEVGINVTVNKDGTAKIIGIDGVPLTKPILT